MKISVRLFAVARQLADSELVTLEVAGHATVKDLRMALVRQFPALEPLAEHLRFSLNTEYGREDDPVGEDDDVACIPPVSGG